MPGWSGITNCEVLEVDEPRRLVYAWGDGTRIRSGLQDRSHLDAHAHRRRHAGAHGAAGFRPQDEGGYKGMCGGWPHIVEGLERVAGEQP